MLLYTQIEEIVADVVCGKSSLVDIIKEYEERIDACNQRIEDLETSKQDIIDNYIIDNYENSQNTLLQNKLETTQDNLTKALKEIEKLKNTLYTRNATINKLRAEVLTASSTLGVSL